MSLSGPARPGKRQSEPMKATLTLLALSCAAAAPPSSTGVRSITLERDCGGCAQSLRITLRSDDSLEWVSPGHERMGTQEQRFSAHLRTGQFHAIASLFIGKNFLALADDYADPTLQDGPWSRLELEREDRSVKQVWRRGEAGPAVLNELEAAVEAVAAEARAADPPRDKP